LQAKDLLPNIQLADTGYVAADQIVLSQNAYGIELVGPPRADYHWQAHAAQGFAVQDFKADWATQQHTCHRIISATVGHPLRDVRACLSSNSRSLPRIVGPVLAASIPQGATPASHGAL
jgi:hypothetical protein